MLLVTGATGLLGSAVLRQAAARGLKATGACRRSPPGAAGLLEADLADPAAAPELVGRARPGWIVHCAALTAVDECEADPNAARELNVEASRRLAAAAAAAGAGFVYVSTDSVFDGRNGGYRETDPTSPLNAYARTKLEGERAAAEACARALIVRTNFFGWSPSGLRSLAEWVLGRLEAGEAVPGFTDVVFSPLLTDHLAAAILDLAALKASGVFHLGGTPTSKFDFARAVAGVFGLDSKLVREARLDDAKLKAPRPKDTSLDSSRAQAKLGRRLPSLEEGLAAFKASRAARAHAGPGDRTHAKL